MLAYRDFCDAHGMNAWHPRTWTVEQDALFYAWKLEAFRAKWAAYKRVGIGAWMPTATICSRVREDLDRLRAPAPSRPWKVCPCHVRWGRRVAGEREPVTHGLAWITATFGTPRGQP